MLLGIDVGGTFTDAVVIADKEILAQAKVPTNHEDVLQSILAALDKVLLDRKMPLWKFIKRYLAQKLFC